MTKEQKLDKELENQKEKVTQLRNRVGQLADRIMILENDLSRFKQNVSNDVKSIVEHIKENR